MTIWNKIKYRFKTGNILMQLIYINSGIFLVLLLIRLGFYISGNEILYYSFLLHFTLPSSIEVLIHKPWTLFTHMFIHLNPVTRGRGFDEVQHILFNMIWLYFGGQIFLNFHDSKKLLSTYILGGLSGAVFFILAMNLVPTLIPSAPFAVAEGASAAVLAIIVAAATTAPNYVVRLVFIGQVKLKYIAIASVILDVLLIPSGNAGGHFGHLGGALFGFIYIKLMQQGTDLTVNFFQPIYWIKGLFYSRKSKIKVVHRKAKTDQQFNTERADRQAEMNEILEKIKRSGYDSLSKKEKEILFKASKEI